MLAVSLVATELIAYSFRYFKISDFKINCQLNN